MNYNDQWKDRKESTEYLDFIDEYGLTEQQLDQLWTQKVQQQTIQQLKQFINKQQQQSRHHNLDQKDQSLEIKLELGKFRNHVRMNNNGRTQNTVQIVESDGFDDKVDKNVYDSLMIHLDHLTQHPHQDDNYQKAYFKLVYLMEQENYQSIVQRNLDNGQLQKQLGYDMVVDFVLDNKDGDQQFDDIIRYSVSGDRIWKKKVKKVDRIDMLTRDNKDISLTVETNLNRLDVSDIDCIDYLQKNSGNVKQVIVRRQYLYRLDEQLSLETTQLIKIDKDNQYFQKYLQQVMAITQNLSLDLFYNKGIIDQIVKFIDSKFNYRIFKNDYQVAIRINDLQKLDDQKLERMLVAADDVYRISDAIGYNEPEHPIEQEKETDGINILEAMWGE